MNTSNNYLLKWQTKYSLDMPNYIHKEEKAGCQKWEVTKYVLGVLKNSFKNWFIKCLFLDCAIQLINRNWRHFVLAAKLTLRRHPSSKAAYKVFKNAFPYHWTAEAGRELWRPHPRTLLKSGHPEQAAQDHVQMDFDYLQGQTSHLWISFTVNRLTVSIIQLTES